MSAGGKWSKNLARWGRSYRKRRTKFARWLLSREWVREAIERPSIPVGGTVRPVFDDRLVLEKPQHEALPYNTRLRLRPGLCIVGYLRSEIGLGQAARCLAYAADSARIPSSFHHLPLHDRENEPEFSTKCIPVPDRKANLLVFGLPSIVALSEEIRGGRHNILYPFWELSGIDREWLRIAERCNEIWAPSSFIADAFRARTQLPVTLVRQPVKFASSAVLQAAERQSRGPLRFLTYFDYDSFGERKNPKAAVNSFRTAFPLGSEDVHLVVKTRGHNDGGLRRWLMDAAAKDSRIQIIDRTVDRDTMERLLADADVFVSLHRSEGFGFGAAEALAASKAVIATDYSGTTDFVNESTGYPIAYKLVPVEKGQYIGEFGQYWAEAELDSAVCAMQAVYDSPLEAKRKSENGRLKLLTDFSPEIIGLQMHALLSERRLL